MASGLVVLTDSQEKDLHPKHKEFVGVRLALQARKVAYGEEVAADAPQIRSVTIEGNTALVRFNHVGRGLKARATNNLGEATPPGKVVGFALAGANGKFVWADGELAGRNTVKLTAPGSASQPRFTMPGRISRSRTC